MKTRLISFVWFCLVFGSVYANQESIKLDSAEAKYKTNKYSEALEEYQKIQPEKDEVSFELLYNIGNCYYKLQDYGNAMLFYQRAKKLNPSDDDLEHNIKIMNTILNEKYSTSEKLLLENNFNNFLLRVKNKYLFFTMFGLLLLTSIFLIIFLYANSLKVQKVFFRLTLLIFTLFLGSLCITNYNYNETIAKQEAIIMLNESDVKSGPANGSNTIIILHSGVKVEVLETLDNWMKIQLTTGEIGWINSQYIEII